MAREELGLKIYFIGNVVLILFHFMKLSSLALILLIYIKMDDKEEMVPVRGLTEKMVELSCESDERDWRHPLTMEHIYHDEHPSQISSW